MKCVYSVLLDRGYSVTIEKDKVYIQNNTEKQALDMDSKACFNTLISLFSLKESWENKKCDRPIYKIEFENKGNTEIYLFDSEVPFNFSFFQAYVHKLVGDSI